MRRETYQRGLPGVKWGIWNCQRKCFQFSKEMALRAPPAPGQIRNFFTRFIISVFAPIFMPKNRICRNDRQTIAGTIFPSC